MHTTCIISMHNQVCSCVFTYKLSRSSAVSLDVPNDWRFFSSVTTEKDRHFFVFNLATFTSELTAQIKFLQIKFRIFGGFLNSPLALIWKMLEEVSWNTSCSSEGLTCVAVEGKEYWYLTKVYLNCNHIL